MFRVDVQDNIVPLFAKSIEHSLFRLLSKVTHNFAAVNKNFANNIKSLRALLTDEAYSEVSSSTHPSYEFPYSRTHSNMNAQVYTIIYKRHGI